MHIDQLTKLRTNIRHTIKESEQAILQQLKVDSNFSAEDRLKAQKLATSFIQRMRSDIKPGLMEVFLAEYGLATDEGIALMSLAEALMRVPDKATVDQLLVDKIRPYDWHTHIGKSSSLIVNMATRALVLAAKILKVGEGKTDNGILTDSFKKIGRFVIRCGAGFSIKQMGNQFVLGETIDKAIKIGGKQNHQGYTHSFDMLGEAALTQSDADRYYDAYASAIKHLGRNAKTEDVRLNPGISIKLSALHPRYEYSQKERVINELVPRVLQLAKLAKQHRLGLNIDAEESERLDLSLDVIEGVLKENSLEGWNGFGVVVQAYTKCAVLVLHWLYSLAEQHDRQIMVRLVKGAYWDSEIKRAQVEGLDHYPVFTTKSATDLSYLCCAELLLTMQDRIFPQFAGHNAHSMASIIVMAGEENRQFELQRLHGMGEGLYQILLSDYSMACRVYAPVGKHKDLLAYLVRRLLENGANSSFVNQVVDFSVPAERIVSDPFEFEENVSNPIMMPTELFSPERQNSQGWDLQESLDSQLLIGSRKPYLKAVWQAKSLTVKPLLGAETVKVVSPHAPSNVVGQAIQANQQDVINAVMGANAWHSSSAHDRHAILIDVAQRVEDNSGELFALLAREAGKTPQDVVAELREAVDFLRYYAAQCIDSHEQSARGIIACISPWNFPLAIFVGQISAALAAGNGVIAKPAESTPLVAHRMIELFYESGVPKDVLQLVLGLGSEVGAELVKQKNIAGVCFTGSTRAGQMINQSMAKHLAPEAPLIAETGGINTMIVDSTALAEQAISDVVRSAFQSAGQRCSALRLLYLQEDIAQEFLTMLYGAIDELTLGNPWDINTDVGPVISQNAQSDIKTYIDECKAEGRLLKSGNQDFPREGFFVSPAVIKVNGIEDIENEIFGPVLHVATFQENVLGKIYKDINASGYGLTFGMHSRIQNRINQLPDQLKVGNIYVNRDQIGAVVGSQPFGGQNLSGTGPKAGGPNYLDKFYLPEKATIDSQAKIDDQAEVCSIDKAQSKLDNILMTEIKLSEQTMQGPTGESNCLYEYGRGVVLCLGPSLKAAEQQASIAQKNGCLALIVCPDASGDDAIDGYLPRQSLSTLKGFQVVSLWSSGDDLTKARQALASRDGGIISIASDAYLLAEVCRVERHVCKDTTAAGGNVSLLAN